MAELQDRQFDTQYEENESWYRKAAINAAVIGGMAFGISKMKGPFGKLVNAIHDDQRTQAAQKEAEKINRDNFANIIKDANEDNFIKQTFVDPNNPVPGIDFTYLSTEASTSLVNDIQRTEQTILEYGNKALRSEYGDTWTDSYHPTFDVLGKTDSEINDNRSKYFTQLRHETLLYYLSREAQLMNENGPAFNYSDIVDSGTNEKYMTEVHEYYLRNSPDYAKLYKEKITRMKKDFWKLGPRQTVKTKASFKDYLYNGKFDASSMTEAEIRAGIKLDQPSTVRKVYGGVVADRQGVPRIDVLEEYHKGLLDGENRWMSRSENFVETGIKKMDMIGEFDYTGYLRDLAETLEKLKVDPTSPISDAAMHMETRGNAQYLRLLLTIEGRKTPEELFIPISRDGLLPGKSRTANMRYDAFFAKGNDLGMSPEKSIFVNKTQDIIRQVTSALDSSLSNKAASDPKGFMKSLQRIVSQYQILPLAQGELRNWAQLLAVHFDDMSDLVLNQKKAPPTKQAMLRNALTSMSNMQKVIESKRAGRETVLLGFDLETIGYGDLGPSKQAKDVTTQIHTAEISEFIIGAKGNIVTDTNTFYSDHVIDYMNKNDGWSSDVNIKWLRSIMSVSPDASDDQVRAHFEKYIRERAKNNPGKSLNNIEYVNKILDELIVKVENATRRGADVKLLTKNGAQFDLMLLRQFNPQKVDRLLKMAPHIDVQSLAYWEKESTYGRHSLRNKTLLQRAMGRQGLNQNIDIELEGGAGRYFREVTSKGNSIMEFAPQHYDKFEKLFSMRAHEAPGVDNIATFHIFANWLSDVENGGGKFSTEHLNKLGKMVSMFGRNPDLLELEELYRQASTAKNKYGHVASLPMASSNQVSKMILTFLDPSDMYVFPNIPHNKDIHQLARGNFNLRVNPVYAAKMRGGAYDYSKWMDKPPIQTEFAQKATAWMVGAHDRTQGYTRQLAYRTFYTAGLFAGREGMDKLSLSAARMTEAHNMVRVALDDVTFNSMPELANGIKKFTRDTKRYALAIARTRAGSRDVMPTFEDYVEASKIVPQLRTYEIPAGSSMAVSQGDLGRKIVKSELAGKIVGIDISRDLSRPDSTLPVMSATLEYLTTLDTAGSFVSRGFGVKAVTTIVSDSMTYGADRHTHADWLAKGHAGSAQSLFLMKAVHDLRVKSIGDGADAKDARAKLTKMANELGMIWTGEQMIMPHAGPSIKKLKHGTSLDEQTMMRKWVGGLDVSFSQVLNYVKDAGNMWKNEDDLARGYYQFFVGWKGNAKTTISEGRKIVEGMIAPHVSKIISDLDSSTSEAGRVFEYFTESGKSEIKSDIQTLYDAFYLPKVGGAKISEFRTPDGKIAKDPTVNNHLLGAMVIDQFSQYGINDGHAIREGSAKVRSQHIDMIRRNEFITDSLKKHVTNNLRVNYSRAHRRAKGKLDQFTNALFSKLSTKTELKLEDIQEIIARKGNQRLAESPGRILTDESKRQIRERLQSLQEMNAIPAEMLDTAADEIISDMEANNMRDVLLNPKTSWMSQYDIKTRERLAAKYGALDVKAFGEKTGVFRMSTGIKEGLTIDFQRILNMGDEGKLKITKKEINTLMTYFNNIFKKSQETGQTGIVKEIVNKQQGDGMVQKVVLNQIVLPAMDRPELMGNRVSNELYLQSDLTRLSDEIMSYRVTLDKTIKENNKII